MADVIFRVAFIWFLISVLIVLGSGGALLFPRIRSRSRKVLWRSAASAAGAFVIAVISAVSDDDRAAKTAGFDSTADQRAALAEGFKDATQWKAKKKIDEERRIFDAAQKVESAAKVEADCTKDLQCWGAKNQSEAKIQCARRIERLAEYDYEWQTGLLTPMFSRLRWEDDQHTIINFIGDAIKFQNQYGTWQFHIYQCVFDPKNPEAVKVGAQPGRLPK